MRNNYYKIWPGGNVTAIFLDKKEKTDYKNICKRLMESDKEIEQVGFVENSENKNCSFHLEMAGGEFCGNAARSAAYLWCLDRKETQVTFTVSGFNGFLRADVRGSKVSLEIPGNFFIDYSKVPEGMLVKLEGISHLIINDDYDRDTVRCLMERYIGDASAIGVIYKKTNESDITIDPYVYVKDIDKIVHETACGSGSIATAIACGAEEDKSESSILQPSGEKYIVFLVKNGIVYDKILLQGNVKILK